MKRRFIFVTILAWRAFPSFRSSTPFPPHLTRPPLPSPTRSILFVMQDYRLLFVCAISGLVHSERASLKQALGGSRATPSLSSALLPPFPPCWPSRCCVTRIILVAAPLKCQYLSSELSSTVLLCFRQPKGSPLTLDSIQSYSFYHKNRVKKAKAVHFS